MSADEQAREVEAVARVIFGRRIKNAAPAGEETAWEYAQGRAREVLAALEPVRAAERQEAAREGERRGLMAAADEVADRISRVVDPDSWRRDGYDDGWASAGETIAQLLRDRADGVTGRSET